MAQKGWVTVIDRFRALRYETFREDTWAVGKAVQEKWKREHGHQPVKDLKRKTNAPGSHCLAVYPPDWIPYIDRVIKQTAIAKAKQMDLFA